MLHYHDPQQGKKHFYDKSPQFWDRVVTGLFACGISIVVFTLIMKWLGYLG